MDDPEDLDDRTEPQAGNPATAEVLLDSGTKQYAGESDRAFAIALARKATSLRRLGSLPESLVTWQQTWVVTKDLKRSLLLEMLSAAAPALADLDGGKALFQIHEAMQEVSAWWRSEPNIHAAGGC